MPVMDGYAATRRLREQPATRDLPVIALTANALSSDRDKCVAAGMNAHVPKPIRMEALYRAMAECLPASRLPLPPAGEPAAEPPDAASPSSLPDFPGLDAAAGLERVGGRLALWYKVLRQFRDNLGARFEADYLAAAGDDSARKRLVHSLKGVAMTLGALALSREAGRMNAALEKADLAAAEALWPAVIGELNTVRDGLAGLERVQDTSVTT